MPELDTHDFIGVPIMAVGGPFHGTGSPPEGDFFDAAYLQALADTGNTYAGEVEAALKIGHSKEQRLLKNSGLMVDEKPAAGWLGNYRVEGGKLLADVKGVPDKLASLWRAGAFKKRSVEISKLTSQKDGKPITVISGLSLLGAKAPAIRTLDDMVAQYGQADADITLRAEVLLAEDEAAGDDVLTVDFADEAADEDDTTFTVNAAAEGIIGYLNHPLTATTSASNTTWRWAASSTLEPKKEETPVARDDTSPMTIDTLTDEQIRSLADTLGVEEADDTKLREAVTQKVTGLLPEEPQPDPAATVEDTPAPAPVLTMSADEIVALRRDAALGVQAHETLKTNERETVLRKAVDDGKLAPAALDHWRGFYDADADGCTKAIETLVVNDNLLRSFGADGENDPDVEAEDAEYRAFAAMTGVTVQGGVS